MTINNSIDETKKHNEWGNNELHINQFPQETQDFIHELCARAIKRAILNGIYIER